MNVNSRIMWQKTKDFRYRLGRVTRGYKANSAPPGEAQEAANGKGNLMFQPASAQALVEFVYVSIPMLFLFIGLFEFGIVFFNNSRLENLTRDMARRVAICGNACDEYKDPYQLVGQDVYPLTSFWLTNNANAVAAPVVATDYFMDPSRVQYIWFQRISPTGAVAPLNDGDDKPVYARDANGQPVVANDYSGLFELYNYCAPPTCDSRFPFKAAATQTSPPPYNANKAGEGWPSGGIDGSGASRTLGRGICEPTHRFFVEIAWRHSWVTPINLLPGLSQPITLRSRRAAKLEALYFTPAAGALCIGD